MSLRYSIEAAVASKATAVAMATPKQQKGGQSGQSTQACMSFKKKIIYIYIFFFFFFFSDS